VSVPLLLPLLLLPVPPLPLVLVPHAARNVPRLIPPMVKPPALRNVLRSQPRPSGDGTSTESPVTGMIAS
jgi:hypothetical protein